LYNTENQSSSVQWGHCVCSLRREEENGLRVRFDEVVGRDPIAELLCEEPVEIGKKCASSGWQPPNFCELEMTKSNIWERRARSRSTGENLRLPILSSISQGGRYLFPITIAVKESSVSAIRGPTVGMLSKMGGRSLSSAANV
jgi:hypothetical protein